MCTLSSLKIRLVNIGKNTGALTISQKQVINKSKFSLRLKHSEESGAVLSFSLGHCVLYFLLDLAQLYQSWVSGPSSPGLVKSDTMGRAWLSSVHWRKVSIHVTSWELVSQCTNTLILVDQRMVFFINAAFDSKAVASLTFYHTINL